MRPQLAWLAALRDPTLAAAWTSSDWEQVIRLSRRLRLLARLAASFEAAGALATVPPRAARHLLAELRLSQARTAAMLWALDRVGAVLGGQGHTLVLLKGSAYIGQELPIASGRLPSDVDILVPMAHLKQAQAALAAAGWTELEMDEHDTRYYREWSHELPPMRHPLHRMELDLHHNILPPVARLNVDVERLLTRLQPSQWPAWQVLHPVDQVLHSAAHLFGDSEVRDRMRDLVDLDGLMRHFSQAAPAFWSELPDRARELGLIEPLALACHFCVEWLGTPVPEDTQALIRASGPGPWRRWWLQGLLSSLLMPTAPDAAAPWHQRVAALVFLARYQRNRLPLRLLLPHLWHKLRARPVAAEEAAVPAVKKG